jgi:hypothetical protein
LIESREPDSSNSKESAIWFLVMLHRSLRARCLRCWDEFPRRPSSLVRPTESAHNAMFTGTSSNR